MTILAKWSRARQCEPDETSAVRGPPQTSSEWRAGWPVLIAAATGTGTGFALFTTTASIFIKPMQEELGWSTSTLAIGPIVLLLSAFLFPVAGMMIDRWGARRIAIPSLGLFVFAYLLLAMMPANKIALYAIVGFIALMGSLSYAGTFLKVVGSWFRQNTGIAIGLCMNGVTLGTVIALPLVGYAIAHWGWRAGYITLAAIVMFLGLPMIILFFRAKPPSTPIEPVIDLIETRRGSATIGAGERSVSEAVRDPRFWLLLFSFMSATLALGGYVAHLQPMLRSINLSMQTAANIGVVLAISMGLGRLAAGFLLDRFWAYGVASLCLIPPVFGSWYLAGVEPGSPILLVLGSVFLLGFAHGTEADFLGYFALKVFGQKSFSTIFGLLATASMIGSASGGISFSFIVDRFQSYALGCQIGGGLFLLSSGLLLGAGLVDRSMRSAEPEPNFADA